MCNRHAASASRVYWSVMCESALKTPNAGIFNHFLLISAFKAWEFPLNATGYNASEWHVDTEYWCSLVRALHCGNVPYGSYGTGLAKGKTSQWEFQNDDLFSNLTHVVLQCTKYIAEFHNITYQYVIDISIAQILWVLSRCLHSKCCTEHFLQALQPVNNAPVWLGVRPVPGTTWNSHPGRITMRGILGNVQSFLPMLA
jgi:hypothetical protein